MKNCNYGTFSGFLRLNKKNSLKKLLKNSIKSNNKSLFVTCAVKTLINHTFFLKTSFLRIKKTLIAVWSIAL